MAKYDAGKFGATARDIKYALIQKATISPSGLNEIVALFRIKKEATEFRLRYNGGQYNTFWYVIVPVSELKLKTIIPAVD